MNLNHMLTQLRGTLPTNVLQPESFSQERPTCCLCVAPHNTQTPPTCRDLVLPLVHQNAVSPEGDHSPGDPVTHEEPFR